MSRLIDADALIADMQERLCKPCKADGKDYHGVACRACWVDDAIGEIDSAPTIDAVEVVRCKDCKEIFFDDWYKCFSCANLYGLNEEVKPNDFCSHGERKESE